MSERIRRSLAFVISIGMVTAVTTGATLAQETTNDSDIEVAAGINADTVDGRHAVKGNATRVMRARKLVAARANGYLPNNIIKKAKDANLLDGWDSTAFPKAWDLSSSAGAINQADNPVHWRQLKGVPWTIADGQDEGYFSWIPINETTPLGPGASKWAQIDVSRNIDLEITIIPTVANVWFSVEKEWTMRLTNGLLRYAILYKNQSSTTASGYKVRALGFGDGIAPAALNRALKNAKVTITNKLPK